LSLFDSQQIAVAIFMASGVVLYEFSVGYLIVAKGVMPARQSLRRFVRLPFLYAVLGAVIMKECGLTLDSTLSACLKDFRGAYSVLGMMVVGLTLSEFRRPEMDWLFSAMSLSWNIGVQPVVGYILFGWVLDVSQPTLAIIFLMLASPMAANEVAIASSLRVSPEIVAPVVMISTLLALVYVPLCLSSAVFAFQ
ncbi:MAG: hypothetical protein OXC07_09520, partial [Kistimonas sp.]|nr:hypothetical protein [Kistimonas sp.]